MRNREGEEGEEGEEVRGTGRERRERRERRCEEQGGRGGRGGWCEEELYICNERGARCKAHAEVTCTKFFVVNGISRLPRNNGEDSGVTKGTVSMPGWHWCLKF